MNSRAAWLVAVKVIASTIVPCPQGVSAAARNDRLLYANRWRSMSARSRIVSHLTSSAGVLTRCSYVSPGVTCVGGFPVVIGTIMLFIPVCMVENGLTESRSFLKLALTSSARIVILTIFAFLFDSCWVSGL